MPHRPASEMFAKRTVIITQCLGAGAKSAAKDMEHSLSWWGISNITVFTGKLMGDIAWNAPTAANRQPVRLMVVRSREGLSAVSEAANIYGAPVAIVVCADHSMAWTRSLDGMVTTDIDASILTDHMMLMAMKTRIERM